MTERQIRWDLPLAQGQAYEALAWDQMGYYVRWLDAARAIDSANADLL